MTHKGTVTLETERLILRQFTSCDTEAMFNNWASSNSDIAASLGWNGNTFDVLDKWVDGYDSLTSYHWAIELKEIGEPIGYINVHDIDEFIDTVEIGYAIGYNFWHKGIVTEATKEVIKYLFEVVGIKKIVAKHRPENERSGGVMMNVGMTYMIQVSKAQNRPY